MTQLTESLPSLACRKAWVVFLAPHTLGMIVNVCSPGILEVEAGDQKFKATLNMVGNSRPACEA